MTPVMANLVFIFALYFVLQLAANALKLAFRGDPAHMQTVGFASSIVSYAYLILAPLSAALVYSLDFRVNIPTLLPDLVLLVLGLLVFLFVLLLDIHLRLVLRRDRTAILDVDEQYIISPPGPAVWELALFNYVLLKSFAYEIFLRGFALTTLLALTDQPVAAICIVAVLEFLLRPHGERLVPTLIVSALFSIIYYATSGLLVTIIIRAVGSYFLSLYMVYLTLKGKGGTP